MGLLEVKHGLLQMAETLDFLHNNARLIHRAISPEVKSYLLSLSLFNFQPCGCDNLCKLEFHIYLCSLLFSPSCYEEKHSGFLGFILRLDHQERTTLLDIKIIFSFRCFYNLVISGSLLLTNALEFLGCLCILHKHNYFMSANDIKCL